MFGVSVPPASGSQQQGESVEYPRSRLLLTSSVEFAEMQERARAHVELSDGIDGMDPNDPYSIILIFSADILQHDW